MFIDPVGQYQFELPLGWAYDPERSHLMTVRFRHWERPNEVVSVRAMPTFASPDANLEKWYEALEERCFPPRMRPFTQARCACVPAALAEAHETDPEKVHRRILVVRGTRIDILVEHRAPEPSTGKRLSEVLSTICRSLEVPTNRFLPTFVKQHEVESYLHHAQEAVRKQTWRDVLDPAIRAQRAAKSTYLYSVVANTPLPEIPAIIALIDALTFIAQATASLLHLRNAEHLALRSLYTVDRLPFLLPTRRHQVKDDLAQRLELITDLQIKIAKQESSSFRPSAAPQLSLLRVDPLLEIAQEFAKRGEHQTALLYCETAIGDLLTFINALEDHPPDFPLPEHLVNKLAFDAKTPAERVKQFQQISRHLQLGTLQDALRLLAHLRDVSGDVVGAPETSEFLVKVGQVLNKPQGTITGGTLVPNKDQPSHLAFALIQHAMHLGKIEDEPSLEEAWQILDEAEKLLDDINEEGVLRAWLCITRASILHSQRRVDGSIETIDRGLRACANEPDNTEKYRRELITMKSQFLIHLGRLQEAEELARATLIPIKKESSQPIELANYYLNLAIVEINMNKRVEAARNLREALHHVLKVDPFGESTLRILHVASSLYMTSNFPLGHQLNLAAAATLDARRVTIASDKYRINFDESIRRREIYEDIVSYLVARGEGKEAAVAADRSRARSLNELLVPPEQVVDVVPDSPSPKEKPPSLESDDVQQALRNGAEYVIRNSDVLLNQSGAVPPLKSNDIEELAREIGVPMLIIQPVREAVALILIRPSGEVEAKISQPYYLNQIMELVDVVQNHLNIFSIPRGENKDAGTLSQNGELDDALTKLWRALIGPINDFLVEDEPLIIVPYREFTLMPFALLRDPEGRLLVEHHALSVVPSLATLRTLRERRPWTRPRPARAYVAGDPALNPNYLLGRLPAARAEAKAVAARLKGAGVGEENIKLRQDEEAHEESYRREARGCDLVHLACHAELEEPAYTSRLYFAPYDQYDGLLLASEITDVKLDDALVFLGACETGQGRATADGVIGLGRAFLEAGARAIIMSLWKVDDTATSVLSGHFYSALLNANNPQSAAEALRAAILATRADLEAGRIIGNDKQPLEPHPMYWAPFIILGDALSIHFKGGQ